MFFEVEIFLTVAEQLYFSQTGEEDYEGLREGSAPCVSALPEDSQLAR